jgi:signal recognition particle subunit SRP19
LARQSKKRAAKKTDFWVVYPEYFDKNLSHSLGRRVPLSIAYDDPELHRIALAAKRAGYEVFLDSSKKYPRTWDQSEGRVLVKKEDSKEKQLREIAKLLSKVKLPEKYRREKKVAKQKSKKARKGSVYRQKKH